MSMTRRDFFSTSTKTCLAVGLAQALARTAGAASAAAAGPAPKVAGFWIGAQCWTFRNFSVLEAIEMTAKAGGSVLEFYPRPALLPRPAAGQVGP
jgi:hypothetical protein